jgi:hypothetical protein
MHGSILLSLLYLVSKFYKYEKNYVFGTHRYQCRI